MYFAKFGRDVEDLEDEPEDLHDAEGTAWKVSVGRGFAEQEDAYQLKLGSLEEALEKIQALYRSKLGDDLDFGGELNFVRLCGRHGVIKTGSRSAGEQQVLCNVRMDVLEESLAEVKHSTNGGRGLADFEDEQELLYDAEGTA